MKKKKKKKKKKKTLYFGDMLVFLSIALAFSFVARM